MTADEELCETLKQEAAIVRATIKQEAAEALTKFREYKETCQRNKAMMMREWLFDLTTPIAAEVSAAWSDYHRCLCSVPVADDATISANYSAAAEAVKALAEVTQP